MQDITIQLEQITKEILEDSAEIIAATAQEYYRDSFRRKGFDGVPWTPAQKASGKGSLLVKSGALANSIRIAEVSHRRVVLAAGGDKVSYAQTHNEGYSGSVQIPEHIRKLKPKSLVSGTGKTEVTVRAHNRQLRIPRRQFMGQANELNELIRNRLIGYIAGKTNQ
ncbi:MAG: phage virion morphogenesis protein [Porphyromonas sp.]|nr:phage virion morphogenesis protein [Porphyromonas sp.]